MTERSLTVDGTLPATTFTGISRSHLHSSGLIQVNMLTAATPRYGYPLCWARGYGMFKWLRWRRETTRTVTEVANRIVARSIDRGEPPADPDQVEELVGIGANLMRKIHALAAMLTLIVPARAVRARAVAPRNGGSELAGDQARGAIFSRGAAACETHATGLVMRLTYIPMSASLPRDRRGR